MCASDIFSCWPFSHDDEHSNEFKDFHFEVFLALFSVVLHVFDCGGSFSMKLNKTKCDCSDVCAAQK